MRVRIAHSITGYRDGVAWPEVGQEIELPDWEAENLIGVGYVTAVAGDEIETPEDGASIAVALGGAAAAGSDAGDPPAAASDPVPTDKKSRRKA